MASQSAASVNGYHSPARQPDELLGILGMAPGTAVTAFVETLLPEIGTVELVSQSTGLVALPEHQAMETRDSLTESYIVTHSAEEMLYTEAHVTLNDGAGNFDGYGACLGRDLDHAVAVATLDAALAADLAPELTARILDFVDQQADWLSRADAVPA